ncbi:MAG: DNA repair and recombination protein RadA [Candidatus Aenigmarchaeota archaeon ex4484_52]|nr:MAG: DNA repair and recombination protein RadA [Candidatus Aenigmarchaeota archaeon ex4484_52]
MMIQQEKTNDKQDEEIKLDTIAGIGPKTAEKLKGTGYGDVMAIATASASEISTVCDIGVQTANKIIASAREMLNMGYETGLEVLEKRKKIIKLTTASNSFDELLGGGFESGSIIECYGAFGSAKTQLAHQLAVNVQLPIDKGGANGGCLYIDTEHTFRPERIIEMAKAKSMDEKKILENIFIGKAYNSDHQILLVEKAKDMIKEKNIKLIIVDSLMSHFRSDYVGRGSLSDRQQKLNKHLHTLSKLADRFNLVVYITNQVMSKPDMLFGDPTQAVGGHVLHHAATFRIYLRKSKGETRIAKLVDSPNLPDGEILYKITNNGIEDM